MPRLVLDEAEHRYFLDGREVPGNTRLLQEDGFIDTTWFTPESRDRGKRVHRASWFLDEGDLDWNTVLEEERGYVEAFGSFKVKNGWRSHANEFAVWSKYQYATTPDMIGTKDGERGVLNLKTGHVDRWVGLQLAGELQATLEAIQRQDPDHPWIPHLEYINGNPYPVRRWALELRRNGSFRLHEFTDPRDLPTFLGVVSKHHWRKNP